jgi:hypothetical protein
MGRTGLRGTACFVSLCLFFFVVSACTSREKHAATYSTIPGESERQQEIVIELKENGQGSWRKGEEEASFTWSINKSEIRLHTKEGGVILGNIRGDTLTIALPNERRIVFKRNPQGKG